MKKFFVKIKTETDWLLINENEMKIINKNLLKI